MPPKSICHITSVHSRYDLRIFWKECQSLTKNYEVNLVVADGKGHERKNNVNIYDAGKAHANRLKRFYRTSKAVVEAAKKLNCGVYHLHDPELLRHVKSLKANKAKVLYDAHEDVPRQILSKYYIPYLLRSITARFFEYYENSVCQRLDGIIAATPFIKKRFEKINKNTVNINNFPFLDTIHSEASGLTKEKTVGYIGGIFKTRGIFEILSALKGTDLHFHLAGPFSPPRLERECQQHPAWTQTTYHGFIPKEEVHTFFDKIRAGFVILSPTPSYINSYPVKMFEYMAAGIPVIASDFPLWESIIEENNCGICVKHNDIEDIRSKTLALVNNTELCHTLGKNGRKAVLEKYNWQKEEEKLLSFYEHITN